MAVKYHFIGWCKTDNHDKVWGIIQLTEEKNKHKMFAPDAFTDDYVAFWGRRGKALSTKVHKDVSKWEMDQLAFKKQNKTKPEECYKEVDKTKLDEVYPEFEQDLKETAFWSKLKL